MKSAPGARARLGYHDHYVLDGGKARIILAALVSPGSVMKNAPTPLHLPPEPETGSLKHAAAGYII
jgi:hypothetical protein